MTSNELIVSLRERYPSQEYALFTELRNATGGGACRSADAVAMSLWLSRGLVLHGFEIKVSRSDWVSEMKKPEKAHEIAQYCDYWWLVIADAGMVHTGELPETWGMMVPEKKTLRCMKQAHKMEAKAVDRKLVASMLRNAQDRIVRRPQLDEMMRRKLTEDVESATGYIRSQLNAEKLAHNALREKLSDFEKVSGVKIDQWHASSTEIGEAVKYVMQWDPKEEFKDTERDLSGLVSQMSAVTDQLKRRLDQVKGFIAARAELCDVPRGSNG